MRANMLQAFFPAVGPNSRTRGHRLKLAKHTSIHRVCTQLFLSQIVNSYNKLANETFTAESVDVFKWRLMLIDFS